jgi:hypothetical protein
MHHMNSDIYVHRRKPTVSPPASNGFHECGHTQEERESLKRPPEGGFFTLSVNFKALVCVVENDPEPYTPTCQWCGSKAGIFDIRGLDKQFHAALPGLSDIEDDDVFHWIAIQIQGVDSEEVAITSIDRHRGGSHLPTPATPPCVRVRTRRFEKLR